MGQRHKHADVIIAWAEGEDVQVRDEGTKRWYDVVGSTPFFMGAKYRIKPPAKKYRVALFLNACAGDNETYISITNSQAGKDTFEEAPSFVRWLTDWIEYEE